MTDEKQLKWDGEEQSACFVEEAKEIQSENSKERFNAVIEKGLIPKQKKVRDEASDPHSFERKT